MTSVGITVLQIYQEGKIDIVSIFCHYDEF